MEVLIKELEVQRATLVGGEDDRGTLVGGETIKLPGLLPDIARPAVTAIQVKCPLRSLSPSLSRCFPLSASASTFVCLARI